MNDSSFGIKKIKQTIINIFSSCVIIIYKNNIYLNIMKSFICWPALVEKILFHPWTMSHKIQHNCFRNQQNSIQYSQYRRVQQNHPNDIHQMQFSDNSLRAIKEPYPIVDGYKYGQLWRGLFFINIANCLCCHFFDM